MIKSFFFFFAITARLSVLFLCKFLSIYQYEFAILLLFVEHRNNDPQQLLINCIWHLKKKKKKKTCCKTSFIGIINDRKKKKNWWNGPVTKENQNCTKKKKKKNLRTNCILYWMGYRKCTVNFFFNYFQILNSKAADWTPVNNA